MTLQLDSLTKTLGFRKTIDEAYQLSFMTALSHYPELDSTKIVLKKAKINTSLNARPTMGSLLFRRKENRKYIIRINTRLKDSLILLEDVPYSVRVGVFGHELGHIYDYSTRSFWGILNRLFAYSRKRSKSSFEKEIDTLTISRNLGLHLYDWAHYVLEESDGTEAYKNFKRDIYLEPEEILELIKPPN
ncbi:MAG: hypothetical protein Crog4KO_10410 [Crocinitomicaceae bacterium]